MPSQIVTENGRRIQRVAGGADLDLGPADAQPGAAGTNAPMGRGFPSHIPSMLLNPELYSSAASMLAPETGGASMAIPAAVGAGTSIARDLTSGERDPLTIGGDALLHGAAGMIPGAGGALTRRLALLKSGVQTASPIVDAASSLPGSVGLAGKIAKLLGIGGEATAPRAVDLMAQHMAPLGDMTLAGGTKVLSSDGLKQLVAKSIELENTPGSASPATRQALDDLIAQVRSHIHPANLSAPGLLESVGLPSTSAMATKAAAAKAAAEQTAGNLALKVRLALGLGNTTASAANDLTRGGQ